jgi:radical SAM protein with 4Fe4S-binding SPASM domain
MVHAKATGEKTADGRMGRLTACGCVFNKMDVLHDGAYVPCNMLSTLFLGRMNKDSVREIWKTHPALAALKARRSISMTEVAGCEGCEWLEFCNGSCPGLAFELTGDFNRANPHDCYRNFLKETGRG